MARQNDIGREGESEARAYPVKHGRNMLYTNQHWHHYELDITAIKEGELIVVEAETRSEGFLPSPGDAVDTKKIQRIIAAVDAYVRCFNIDLPVRFDIVTLIKEETGFLIDRIEDAFYAPYRQKIKAMNMEEVREYRLSLKNTIERFPFNEALLVFKVRNKVFLLLPLDAEEPHVSLRCSTDYVEELREHHTAVEPAYHFNKKYWDSIYLDRDVEGKEIKRWIFHSYREVIVKLLENIREIYSDKH